MRILGVICVFLGAILQNFPGACPQTPYNGRPKVDLWRHTIMTKLAPPSGIFCVRHFQRAPQLHWFLVLHISIWGVKAFFGELSGDGTAFWTHVTAWAPTIEGYGMWLIRLCSEPFRLEKFAAALRRLKPGKSPGLDSIWIPCSQSSYHMPGLLSNLGFATSSFAACANSKFQRSGEEH